MKTYTVILLALWLGINGLRAVESPASPENQVFQFMQAGTCFAWQDGSSNHAAAYLWIPEHCEHVRGLLILCANVPEHRLVGHPAIRAVCAANDLGVVWCVPSFMNFRKDKEKNINDALDYPTSTKFLQQLLDGLAQTSGYAEVATVPWLPIGESGHLLMVDALVEYHPERCIAGVWLKNNHLPPKNREVPALVAFGSAQEWSQDKTDIRTNWNNVRSAYEGVVQQRASHPAWPLTYLIDGSSGHFDCSDRLTQFLAHYIDAVAKARLPEKLGAPLRSLTLTEGYLAELPVPGHEHHDIVTAAEAGANTRGWPWYFDRESAQAAQSFAAINWQADTQLPAFTDAAGQVLPFNFNGISSYTPEMEADGITFTLHGTMLSAVPTNFVNPGLKLAHADVQPQIEWLCGPVKPLGNDRFQICLDRTWPGAATYLAAREPGTETLRGAVQPCGIKVAKNNSGLAQKISFAPIADVPAGTQSLKLHATSSAGLPVRYFVRAGPAVVHGDSLEFTPVPPRARYPVAVIVDAWQWGRAGGQPVQSAVEEQTFYLKAP